MTRLLLSTGNIVSGGSSIIKKPGSHRSNSEFTNSLRDNFLAAQQDCIDETSTTADPSQAELPRRPPYTAWTAREDGTLYIPRIDWSTVGLLEDPAQYDITVKMFFLPGGSSTPETRLRYLSMALSLVFKELGATVADLLIISFPGMSFEGECEWKADKLNADQGNDKEEQATWIAAVRPLQAAGLVKKLGVAEFGGEKLSRFVARVVADTGKAPDVDQINMKSCCNVPPPLVKLAKEHDIELLVHSDCTDILPKGTLRELLDQSPRGAGVLSGGNSDAEGQSLGLGGELTPEWVVKYTAVVRDRGVIESKGYFASAVLAKE